jgi:hypothetical protein
VKTKTGTRTDEQKFMKNPEIEADEIQSISNDGND